MPLLLIPHEIGLCDRWEGTNTCNDYESIGAISFFSFFSLFILGSLFFTLSNKNRKNLRTISLWVIPFALVFYIVMPSDSSMFLPSTKELIGWPLIVTYGAIILGLEVRELFEPMLKRFSLWKIILSLIVITGFVFWLIVNWL